ncbi:hypothetical protein QM565_08300 [Geitlerinema splendidum]|nr:hypothetical protein [Geitlerinema splendidum]
MSQLEAKKIEAGQHPFYAGHSNAAQLKNSDLNGHTQSLSHSDPVSQMLHQSIDSRPQVKIDPSKDSLITGSQKIIEAPLQEIGGEGTHVVEMHQGHKEEILTCEEPGDDSIESCTNQLIVEVRKIIHKKELETNFHIWLPYGKKKYVYLACGALRNAVQEVYHNGGEITAPYKACMQELSIGAYGCCASLPSLSFPVDKIKEVRIEKTLVTGRRGHISQSFILNYDGHTHKTLGRKKKLVYL